MKYKKTLFFTFILLIIFIFWTIGFFIFVNNIDKNTNSYPKKRLDAIVVLTGGSNRIDEGFNLLEKKLAKKLFISGVYRGVDAKQLLRRWKKESKAKLDCCVVLGFKAENTAENAKEAIAWLQKEKFKSFYLVTSNYHMQRAMLEFKRSSFNMKIEPFNIIPDKNNANINLWYEDKKTRYLVFKEYTKYIIVYLINNIMKR